MKTAPTRLPEEMLESLALDTRWLYYSEKQDEHQEKLRPEALKGKKSIFVLEDGKTVAATAWIPVPGTPLEKKLSELKKNELEKSWPDAIFLGKGRYLGSSNTPQDLAA